MIPRLMGHRLMESLRYSPVVTVLGPRQAGKTTLVKMCLPDFAYANLENPENRQWALQGSQKFSKGFPGSGGL